MPVYMASGTAATAAAPAAVAGVAWRHISPTCPAVDSALTTSHGHCNELCLDTETSIMASDNTADSDYYDDNELSMLYLLCNRHQCQTINASTNFVRTLRTVHDG